MVYFGRRRNGTILILMKMKNFIWFAIAFLLFAGAGCGDKKGGDNNGATSGNGEVTPGNGEASGVSQGVNPTGTFDGLKTRNDSISYGIGVDIANNLSRQGIEFDVDALAQGMRDKVTPGGTPLMTDQQVQALMMSFQQEMQQKAMAKQQMAAGENLEKGKAFLAANKNKPGVTELPNGLQYKVIKPGTGANPAPGSSVTIRYRGKLIDGTEFDSSYKNGPDPVTFNLNGLIQAWKIALPMMKEGATWEIYCPSELGYGMQAPPNIGPNQVLVFEIELVKAG